MTPSPEFYLEEISKYKGYESECTDINEDWERAKADSQPLFYCYLEAKNQNFTLLEAILDISSFYGFGRMVIPFEINRNTPIASQKFPGLEMIVRRNQESLGRENFFAACSVLGIDISKCGKEFKVTKDSIYFSTDSTNKHVTKVTGVVIERDAHAIKYFPWRNLPAKLEPMYYVVSAKGFVRSLQGKFSTLKVSPGDSSILNRR